MTTPTEPDALHTTAGDLPLEEEGGEAEPGEGEEQADRTGKRDDEEGDE